VVGGCRDLVEELYVKRFEVVVGLSQWSLGLASLESLKEPSWVRRPRLFVGLIHWSGWKDVMLSCCPSKLPGGCLFVHSVS
jgi:hypothetical protein